jgi:protease PrsW
MKRAWFWVLLIGVVLFIISDTIIQDISSSGLMLFVIILGAMIVPVTFVIYFYEHIRDRDISLVFLIICFLIGGGIGVGAAAIIEYNSLTTLHPGSLIVVGLIEESAKMIMPLAAFMIWPFRHEADGLIIGVTVGMGFAALETIGYGFSTLAQSNDSVSALNQVLLFRGLLSPAGHAAWTGIICGVLWRERELAGQWVLNLKVIPFFVLAVVLHASWDIVNTQNSNAVAYLGTVVVATISLGTLMALYQEARRRLKPM